MSEGNMEDANVRVSVPPDQLDEEMVYEFWYVLSTGRVFHATADGTSKAYPFTPDPPVTSGPADGKGCVVKDAQEKGKEVHPVHTFHQLRPVPPVGCAVILIKNDAGRLVPPGTDA